MFMFYSIGAGSVLLLVIFLLLIFIRGLVRENGLQKERIRFLEKRAANLNRQCIKAARANSDMGMQIKVLQDANSKRLNHKTASLMEEILAKLMVAIRERDIAAVLEKQEQSKRAIEEAALREAFSLLQMGRTDPHKFNPDQPNGRIEH